MTSTPNGARQQDDDPSRTTQLRVPPQLRTGGHRLRPKKALPRYDYEHYSRLAGPLTQPDPSKPYKVQYRSLLSQEPHRVRAALLLGAAPLVSLWLVARLFQTHPWPERDHTHEKQ
ncbi:glycosyl transferase, partial [[Kitasatospora] papulosa]